MMGDGQTSYDQAHDGDETNIAACSVRDFAFLLSFPVVVTSAAPEYLVESQ